MNNIQKAREHANTLQTVTVIINWIFQAEKKHRETQLFLSDGSNMEYMVCILWMYCINTPHKQMYPLNASCKCFTYTEDF